MDAINLTITFLLYLCLPLVIAIPALISGYRFETGRLRYEEKARYLRTGSTLKPGTYYPGGTGNVFGGRETHLPLGIGIMVFCLANVYETIKLWGAKDEEVFSVPGFMALGFFFVIAVCRAMSKGTLTPRWAKDYKKEKE